MAFISCLYFVYVYFLFFIWTTFESLITAIITIIIFIQFKTCISIFYINFCDYYLLCGLLLITLALQCIISLVYAMLPVLVLCITES